MNDSGINAERIRYKWCAEELEALIKEAGK
jgi:hypothetical protein